MKTPGELSTRSSQPSLRRPREPAHRAAPGPQRDQGSGSERGAGVVYAERYDGATIRDVARRAGVDPALVHHYFDNKQTLFVAAIQVPVDPTVIIDSIARGDPLGAGERIAHTFLATWDIPENQSPMVALLRSAASNERAAVMFREFISREIFARIMRALDVSDPDLRASLVATQLLGVALMRYVIGVEPLASTPSDRLADMIAPTLQRYLTEPLPH